MFTRDLRLEDCILDLIDNSMDALLTSRGTNIDQLIVAEAMRSANPPQKKASIRLDISDRKLAITDDCGGIKYDDAVHDVFCFGHGLIAPKKRLGIYGIGLKRAIFKIGNHIRIESKTSSEEAFEVVIEDVAEWAKKDDSLDDWTFPIKRTNSASSLKAPGTSVVITQLHDEVKARLNDGTIDQILTKSVSQSYPFFLDNIVEVRIGGEIVPAIPIPFGGSESVDAGASNFTQDGVKVSILATVAPKDKRSQELAGWYVMCNGRVVVNANKDDLTGWGNPMPSYHSKYRGFIGLVSFTSEDPARLPWTTSKRGLNRENLVFQRARNVMAGAARPVLTFLNQMYPSDLDENPVERQVADTVVQRDFMPLLSGPSTSFATRSLSVPKQTVRVQFDAKKSDVQRIKKKLRRPGMSASEVGKFTFDHYLQTECPE